MFDDDKQPNPAGLPVNLPVEEPEDMFAGVDKQDQAAKRADDALSAGLLIKKDPIIKTMPDDMGSQSAEMNQVSAYKMKEPILGKIIFIVLLIVLAVALLLGGWLVYAKYFQSNGSVNSNNSVSTGVSSPTATSAITTNTAPVVSAPASTQTTATTSSGNDIANQVNNDKILFGESIDTDGDGLDDIREKQLKTDINKKDTDGDGLNDYDEVIIWGSDPLKTDTDGDTYLDGHEVQNGYSPTGPGKIVPIKIPTSTASST
ncbi:MAG: hypothetical protein COU31_03820 [Candidatus Magasanikbacteria bacterium CG10_big_fil_rev_8_21_14_0_10_40_10]|uniref:Uncharacterized protein n=1 Tax=Candidatus Magasanikbacteria bacterium CG10_big_fil_rev_8_21_14_0_10_40_10 TaxID=1974648 RepID=A0A2M6W3F7_9BACT|nr:MAG: hypothetical protein COU31_03820 [Candidatus Magasanikbacteria bacterium CG10_big_fil_rev_8_21_14_0_10_40_10]